MLQGNVFIFLLKNRYILIPAFLNLYIKTIIQVDWSGYFNREVSGLIYFERVTVSAIVYW